MKDPNIQSKLHQNLLTFTILVFLTNVGHSTMVQRDSLLQYLNNNGIELTKTFLSKRNLKYHDQVTRIESEYLLAIISSDKNPEQVADILSKNEVLKSLNSTELIDLLRFINESISYLIQNKDAYISANLTGYKITLNNQQYREAYHFLSQLITYYRLFKDPEKTKDILSKMKSLAGKDNYLTARYHIMEGYVYMTDQDDRCIPAFQNGIKMMEPFLGKSNDFLTLDRYSLVSDSVNVASAYLEYSKWMQIKGDLKKSGELLIMGKRLIPADTAYIVHQINYYNSLSSIYADLKNPTKSKEYALLSVDIAERKNFDKLRNSSIALFLAKALVSEGKYKEAIIEYQKVLLTAKSGSRMLRNTFLNIAKIYYEMGNYDMMNSYLNQSDTLKVIGPDVNLLSPLMHGYSFHVNKNYKKAINIAQEVLSMAIENNDIRFKSNAYLLLSKSYEDSGDFLKGLYFYKLFTASIDTLYNQGQEMAVFDLTADYENEKKEAQIASLSETNLLKNSVINTQRLFLIGLILGAIALTIFIYLLTSFNKKLSSRNIIIEKSVEEKNILLREIHHRVKNNLQMISSLLKLQTVYIKDANAVQAITEGRSRVQAMAILHQNLYSDTSLTGVNIETYFENLIQGLFDTYNISEDKIHLVKNITPLILDVDTVIPLGLISNELISNALKHAFNESLSGKIEVTLQEINSELVLRISDDGIGYISGKENPGFGSKLIQTLSDKMNAILEISNDIGCTVKITIKEYQKVG